MKDLLTLNKYLWRYKWRLIFGCLLLIGSNLFAVFSVDFVREATNIIADLMNKKSDSSVDISGLKNQLLFATLMLVAFAMIGGLLKFGMRQMIIVSSRLVEYDLKNEIYQHYQKLSLSFYKRNKTGDLINRIGEDVSQVRMYLGPGLMYPINLVSLILITFFVMIRIDVTLTLYTLSPLPVLSILIYYVANIINKKSRVLQEQQSTLSSFVQDSFSGIRVIKSFNIATSVNNQYADEAKEYEKRALSLAETQAFFFPLMILIVGISYIMILYVGGMRYINGGITEIGVLAQFFIYLNMLIWPFTALGWVTMVVQRAEASMKRINEFLQEEPEIVNEAEEQKEINGSIEFKNVSFVYENTGIQALNNVSFKLNQGKTLAILGKTGSGKSTLISLLSRLYDPSSGQILVDNIDVKEHNLYQLRRSVGFVPQEAFLFSDTVKNNLLFGVDSDKQEDAETFAKKAVVHQNIIDFADGYETKVGERGVTLSGGQKQRVSIARALVKQPEILVFDDSLSAVDTETEEEILKNLNQETKNRTTIIVTHRVSSAKNADKIIILDQGKIIEQGTHSELLNANGYYAELYNIQLNTQEKSEI